MGNSLSHQGKVFPYRDKSLVLILIALGAPIFRWGDHHVPKPGGTEKCNPSNKFPNFQITDSGALSNIDLELRLLPLFLRPLVFDRKETEPGRGHQSFRLVRGAE